MRITIIDNLAGLVVEVLENVDPIVWSDFLTQYLDVSYTWCVTSAGFRPAHFQHDQWGMYL